eukprot:TRINITY_DN1582_c0_g1_i1.p1 TRINITY_DN1582_c0_g1~~TRINITY_DN1582_c0_g1_i1.p1  ORF type:complete len:466 (+),score=107.58 TRINITY_DN1582_c0_g1_i1:41-1399(+)
MSTKWAPSSSNSLAAKQEIEADLIGVLKAAGSPQTSVHALYKSGIAKEQLPAFYERLSARIGVHWGEQFGNFLIARALQKFDPTESGQIAGPQLELFVKDLALLPRPVARHPKRVAVFGGGAFGVAMATVLARKGNRVKILMLPSEAQHVQAINETHHNTMAFPEHKLDNNISATIDPKEALAGAEFVVHAIPVQFSEGFLAKLKDVIPPNLPIISISKGISTTSLEFMNEIIPRALGRDQPAAFVCGPSFARGILEGDPTAVTVASTNPLLARSCQTLLSSPTFRLYTSVDVVGVEVGSALKNVLAIASGVAKGLGYGANTQAMLVTRGWADIGKICVTLGARTETLSGLAGIGDLMLTCFGGESRNNKFGQHLGKTNNVEEAKAAAGGVVEGYYTATACRNLAIKLGLELPVISAIASMLDGSITPSDMISFVMTLPLGHEDGTLASAKL